MKKEQIEITTPVPLLDEKGNLAHPGYAKRMFYQYNPYAVAAHPFALKEWDFYQLMLGEYILQLTIGHVSYMANFSANLFSIETGRSQSFSRMRPLPFGSLKMSTNPEDTSCLAVKGKDYHMVFDTKETHRQLTLQAKTKTEDVDIKIELPINRADEKIVIATPFNKKGQFYLNCKEHYYNLKGQARFGETLVNADEKSTALLDWGRGVWPFSQEWFWGSGASYTSLGHFGFNIGWGFGNLENATENMFFYNGKAYKLGELIVKRNEEDYMEPWHFQDENGLFDFTMIPVYDNYTSTKVLFVDNSCHQVFGKFSGKAVLPDGEVIYIENMMAFCEHAINNW